MINMYLSQNSLVEFFRTPARKVDHKCRWRMEHIDQHELRILLLSTTKGAEQQQLVQLAQQVVARGLCELAVVLCNSQTVSHTDVADKYICTVHRRLLNGGQAAVVLRSDRLFWQDNDEQPWQHMQQAVPCLLFQQSSGPQLRLLCCSGLFHHELQSRLEQNHHQAVTVAAGLLRPDDALRDSDTHAGQHPLQVNVAVLSLYYHAPQSASSYEPVQSASLGTGNLCSPAVRAHS